MTFDPSEKRDSYGRWAAGGEAGVIAEPTAPNAESARRYAKAATRVATELGFDPKKIAVVGEARPKFELNGVMHDWAGAANLKEGTIKLYEPFLYPSSVEDTIAHEIGHQKFQRFIDDYSAEKAKMDADIEQMTFPPGKDMWDTVMKPDGLLREPYAEKYPLYQKYTEVMMPSISENFAKSDGITDYSKEWWKAWWDQKAQTNQAMHETIAEMTARAYTLPATFEGESPKFKAAGFSLDEVHGTFGKPSTFSVRKWKGKTKLDESTLPKELQGSLDKLRARANYEARFLNRSGAMGSKYGTPAPEWNALYDAVQEHWNKT